jgi:hypothetical protein
MPLLEGEGDGTAGTGAYGVGDMKHPMQMHPSYDVDSCDHCTLSLFSPSGLRLL